MKIETKFDVNNLVKRKFDTDGNDKLQALEVMEISSQTCYAGTQIFYHCKPIVATKEFKEKWKEQGEFSWVIGHGIGKDDNSKCWRLYREDELIDCPESIINIILGKE